MKNVKIAAFAILGTLTLASCKNEAKMNAEKTVDNYASFVDSVNNLDAAERAANWEAIQEEYEVRTVQADSAAAVLENDAKTSEKITKAKSTYEGVKVQAEETAAKQATDTTAATGNALADALFGAGAVVGNDMAFKWVNKDNILSVYEKFYESFKANRDSYSRQDLDKVKAWYEALDARKNTVEKEGLSAEDNRKIAAVKIKFAPMFKWDRVTAKGDENSNAKDAAN